MKDFEKVERYVWTVEGMEEYIKGNWVDFDDYEELLEEYKELKYRMDSLEH